MTKIFYITGDINKEQLLDLADKLGIKVHIIKRSKRWQVITSGAESQAFYDFYKNR
jgi:hypothetical protein